MISSHLGSISHRLATIHPQYIRNRRTTNDGRQTDDNHDHYLSTVDYKFTKVNITKKRGSILC